MVKAVGDVGVAATGRNLGASVITLPRSTGMSGIQTLELHTSNPAPSISSARR